MKSEDLTSSLWKSTAHLILYNPCSQMVFIRKENHRKSIYLLQVKISTYSFKYWQRSKLLDNWGHLRGFTDQLLPCLTNAMSLLHELTFQVSKNRWKAQSGATFTSRPQILFLSVCVQCVLLPGIRLEEEK